MIRHKDMMAAPVDPGWDDGRTGFLWCRVDALLDKTDGVRAEITWADDADDSSRRTPTEYYDPQLLLQTNRRERGDELRTVKETVIVLSDDQALAYMAAPPQRLLEIYADQIGTLRTWSKP